jgi:hypothetical protein
MGQAGLTRAAATLALGAAVALAGALAGCADKVLPVDQAGRTTALPTGPAATTAQTPQPPEPTASPPGPHDQCGAADLKYLIGKSRLEIPVPVDPSKRRVVCKSCPVTMDYRADRQTITYDPATNLVTDVACG